MLNIYFGEMPEAIYDTSTYFRHAYKDKWITDPMTVEIIRDVDSSEVVGSNLVQSPVLGPISYKYIMMSPLNRKKKQGGPIIFV